MNALLHYAKCSTGTQLSSAKHVATRISKRLFFTRPWFSPFSAVRGSPMAASSLSKGWSSKPSNIRTRHTSAIKRSCGEAPQRKQDAVILVRDALGLPRCELSSSTQTQTNLCRQKSLFVSSSLWLRACPIVSFVCAPVAAVRQYPFFRFSRTRTLPKSCILFIDRQGQAQSV